ncbi:MAG: twin-arginine translocase TatA/TatE family subunit [Micrococcaceae bacterium]
MPRGWPLVIIIILALLLFAAPKLPAMARNLGQSMRILKSEVKQMRSDDDGKDNSSSSSSSSASSRPVEGTVVDNEQPRRQGEDSAPPENDGTWNQK